MLKKLIDTNIFIDRFSDPDLYKDTFLSEGLVYLSWVALMELKAGAHSKEAVSAVNDLVEFFRRADKIVVPSVREYELAGEIVAKLQTSKGYNEVLSRARKRERGTSGRCRASAAAPCSAMLCR